MLKGPWGSMMLILGNKFNLGPCLRQRLQRVGNVVQQQQPLPSALNQHQEIGACFFQVQLDQTDPKWHTRFCQADIKIILLIKHTEDSTNFQPSNHPIIQSSKEHHSMQRGDNHSLRGKKRWSLCSSSGADPSLIGSKNDITLGVSQNEGIRPEFNEFPKRFFQMFKKKKTLKWNPKWNILILKNFWGVPHVSSQIQNDFKKRGCLRAGPQTTAPVPNETGEISTRFCKQNLLKLLVTCFNYIICEINQFQARVSIISPFSVFNHTTCSQLNTQRLLNSTCFLRWS